MRTELVNERFDHVIKIDDYMRSCLAEQHAHKYT